MSDTHTPLSCSLACTVNGRAVALEVPAHALLLDVLRERLGLKGAKRSCDMQVCGACTVLVDGAPVSSCTYLAVEADGAHVLTVEGLGDGDNVINARRNLQSLDLVSAAAADGGDDRALRSSRDVRLVSGFADALDHMIDLLLGSFLRHVDDHWRWFPG